MAPHCATHSSSSPSIARTLDVDSPTTNDLPSAMTFVDHQERDDKPPNDDQAPHSISPHQDVVIIDDLEDDEVHEMAASVTALPFRRASSKRRSSRTLRSPHLPQTDPVEDKIGEKPPSPHSPPPPADFLSTRRSSSARKPESSPP